MTGLPLGASKMPIRPVAGRPGGPQAGDHCLNTPRSDCRLECRHLALLSPMQSFGVSALPRNPLARPNAIAGAYMKRSTWSSCVALVLFRIVAGCTPRRSPYSPPPPPQAVLDPVLAPSTALAEAAAEELAFAGLPETQAEMSVTVLENTGFVVGCSDVMKNPLWVSYRVFPVENSNAFDRPGWHTDNRTEAKVHMDCYAQELPGNHEIDTTAATWLRTSRL